MTLQQIAFRFRHLELVGYLSCIWLVGEQLPTQAGFRFSYAEGPGLVLESEISDHDGLG
jgi:hypothetical protein